MVMEIEFDSTNGNVLPAIHYEMIDGKKVVIQEGVYSAIRSEPEWWQCQKCSRDIGLLGRFVRWVFGCRIYDCNGAK